MPRKEPTQYEKSVAARAKRIAEDKRITQEEIAESLGITQGAVGQYLNGHIVINLKRLLDLCKALSCAPHDLDPEQHIFDLYREDEKEIISLIRSANPDEVREIRRFLSGYISKK